MVQQGLVLWRRKGKVKIHEDGLERSSSQNSGIARAIVSPQQHIMIPRSQTSLVKRAVALQMNDRDSKRRARK
jgi:hypothetical protein